MLEILIYISWILALAALIELLIMGFKMIKDD